MDEDRFDTLARALRSAPSRRAALGSLAAGAFGLLGWADPRQAAAKNCKKIKNTKKRKKCLAKSGTCQPRDQATTCGLNGCGTKTDNCGNAVECGGCSSANSCVSGFCTCAGGAPCGTGQTCCGDLGCKAALGGVCSIVADCCGTAGATCSGTTCCLKNGASCTQDIAASCCTGICNGSGVCGI